MFAHFIFSRMAVFYAILGVHAKNLSVQGAKRCQVHLSMHVKDIHADHIQHPAISNAQDINNCEK